jgi:hypothetical protein
VRERRMSDENVKFVALDVDHYDEMKKEISMINELKPHVEISTRHIAEFNGISSPTLRKRENRYMLPSFGAPNISRKKWTLKEYLDWVSIPVEEWKSEMLRLQELGEL